MLRRTAFACGAGAIITAAVALAWNGRGALGCGALALLLAITASLLTRRARWHERLSAQFLDRLATKHTPERTPTPEEIKRLIERANRKPLRWARTWRP
ncbi:hypothetical protein A7982_12165 [Minicystis rosea]|nr:hypothetical protein A7982_12165 [Minicystis rosea]